MGGNRRTDSRADCLSDAGSIVRLKVRLLGVTPMVWRRLEVSAATTLQGLHGVIQVVISCTRVHLFLFELRAADFGHPIAASRSADVIVGALALRRGEKLRYVCDMGDYWEHERRVEGFREPSPSTRYPRCVGGSGACPPENCAGPLGHRVRREEAVGYEALCDVEDMVGPVREILSGEPERPIRKDDPRFDDLVATAERLGALFSSHVAPELQFIEAKWGATPSQRVTTSPFRGQFGKARSLPPNGRC